MTAVNKNGRTDAPATVAITVRGEPPHVLGAFGLPLQQLLRRAVHCAVLPCNAQGMHIRPGLSLTARIIVGRPPLLLNPLHHFRCAAHQACHRRHLGCRLHPGQRRHHSDHQLVGAQAHRGWVCRIAAAALTAALSSSTGLLGMGLGHGDESPHSFPASVLQAGMSRAGRSRCGTPPRLRPSLGMLPSHPAMATAPSPTRTRQC